MVGRRSPKSQTRVRFLVPPPRSGEARPKGGPQMRKFSLEVIVFVSGAVVMVLELAGSRVIAPFFGVSLPVWTLPLSPKNTSILPKIRG